MTTATTYTIRVDGLLDEHWADWLGQLDVTNDLDGTTTVTVPVVDQAQLHGVLARLHGIGAVVLDLRSGGGRPPNLSPVLKRTLHTDRLSLRPGTAADADGTWAYRRLESVNEWLSGCPSDLAEYREQFAEPARLANTVTVTLGHDPAAPLIGDFMLRREDAWAQPAVADDARGKQAELGWVLDPAYTGRGYATEAVRELLRYCFRELGVHRVVANCFLANDTSWRLMERVGMRREVHAVRESLHRSGRWLDTVGYALLAEEWFRLYRELKGRS